MEHMPNTAKQVFNGILFDVYHWEQEMFDGTMQTFECLRRQSSTEVIATAGDNILTIIQEQPGRMGPYPALPAGRLEEGENPEEGAKRELLEETGYACEHLLPYAHYTGTSKLEFHEYVFIGRDCKKIAESTPDVGEKITLEYKTFDEFLHLARVPSFTISMFLKFAMYEALLDPTKKEELREKIFG